MSIKHGATLGLKIEQSDSPGIEFQADGTVLVSRKWKCGKQEALGLCPRARSQDAAFENQTGLKVFCVNSKVEPQPGSWALISASYQGYETLPPIIYEFQNSRMDRPIVLHPKFNDKSVFPDACKVFDKIDPNLPAGAGNRFFSKFKDSKAETEPDSVIKFAGVTGFVVGTAQWVKTEFSEEPDFDISDVGTLQAPEVGPYLGDVPDAANTGRHWLKVDKSCSNLLRGASILFQTREVWLYNSLTWLREIYDPNYLPNS